MMQLLAMRKWTFVGPCCWALLLVFPTSAKLLNVPDNMPPLSPTTPWIEIHPVKGRESFLDFTNLHFQAVSATDSSANVDAVAVPLPESCTAETCDWEALGIGKTVDGVFSFCCPPADAPSDGGVSDYPAGTYTCRRNSMALDPNKASPYTQHATATAYAGNYNRYGGGIYSMELAQPGTDWALILVTCHETVQVQAQGHISWENVAHTPYANEVTGLTLAGDLSRMARHCNINVDWFNGQDNYDESYNDDLFFVKEVTDFIHSAAETCTPEETAQFQQVFSDFAQCANGFDLQEFIEHFPSGMIGTLLECAALIDWDQVDDWMDFEDIMSMDIPEACLDFEFGDNAVGYGMRQMALYPDVLLPCLKELSTKVPSCMLETWPIPIAGDLLKYAACMAGDAGGLMDDIIEIEMGVWEKCLPEVQQGQAYDCDKEDCILEGSLMARGSSNWAMPVSDAMERIAKSNVRFAPALDKYKHYLEECTDAWDGWTNYANQKEAGVTNNPSLNGGSPTKNSSGGISKVGLAFLMFFFGGMLGVFAVFVYDRHKRVQSFKKNATKGGDLQQLEMTEPPAPLGGGYKDTTSRDEEDDPSSDDPELL